MRFSNPILPGFYPDPSVCRVGEDYYLVNSSFEYFPGVPIHHSRDLVHWSQIGHCLTRPSQNPLAGQKASDGIYAPTIRYHNGRFYMITTNMAGGGNFYVTTDNPAGDWSEPFWLKQKGIDPSLFFDDDGKVYMTGNGTLWAPVRGIYQCELNIETGEQLTETKFIWPGTGGAYPEAPHLFKRAGYYYLIIAEGGTADCHMVSIARSRSPYGPFESCPGNPVLTHRSLMNPIQGTGHADFFEDHRGDWWTVFLGIRYAEFGFHNLGRETFLAPIEWVDDWPVVNGGNRVTPEMDVEQCLPPHPWPAEPVRDDFDATSLGFAWNFLRNPHEADWSLTDRPGSLRLRCSPVTLNDLDSPAYLGRRQQHFECRASTSVDFTPGSEHEEAGLTVLIDNQFHCEIAVTLRGGRRTAIVRRTVATLSVEVASAALPDGPVELWIAADRSFYTLGIMSDGEFRPLAKSELRFLSTEVAGGYTGVMFGIYATARGTPSANAAWFDWFDYQPGCATAK